MEESQIKKLYKDRVIKPDYEIENGYDFSVSDTLKLYNNEPIEAVLFFYFKKKMLTALHTLMFVEKKDTLPIKNYFDSCFNKKIMKDSTAVIGDIEIGYNPDLKGWNLDGLHTCISYRIKVF